jgi:hypothetical protein
VKKKTITPSTALNVIWAIFLATEGFPFLSTLAKTFAIVVHGGSTVSMVTLISMTTVIFLAVDWLGKFLDRMM